MVQKVGDKKPPKKDHLRTLNNEDETCLIMIKKNVVIHISIQNINHLKLDLLKHDLSIVRFESNKKPSYKILWEIRIP